MDCSFYFQICVFILEYMQKLGDYKGVIEMWGLIGVWQDVSDMNVERKNIEKSNVLLGMGIGEWGRCGNIGEVLYLKFIWEI